MRFFSDLLVLYFYTVSAWKQGAVRSGDEWAVRVKPQPTHLGAESCGLKHVMRTSRLSLTVRWAAILSPVLAVLSLLLIAALPQGFSFMMERPTPWYTPFTSAVFIVGALFVWPVTQLLGPFGVMPFSPVWVVGALLYGGGLSFVLYRVLRAAAA